MDKEELVRVLEADLVRVAPPPYKEVAGALIARARKWLDGDAKDVADIGNDARGLLNALREERPQEAVTHSLGAFLAGEAYSVP